MLAYSFAPGRGSRFVAIAALCVGLLALASNAPARADSFPSKPIRIVVPFAAGGAVDSVARIVGEPLSQRLGQPVIVENKPGNHANIGAQDVVRAPADGYTLLLGANGLVTNPWLDKNMAFKPLTDLMPVARVGYAPLVLLVPAKSPYKTLKELIAAGRQEKSTLNYGSSGVGGSGHLAVEMLKHQTGMHAMHIGYKGGAPALTDLIGGRLDFMMVNPLEAAPHVAAGNVRALGVATRTRIDTLPQVPTFAQAGVPDFEATVWWGFMAPAKTPVPVVGRLSKEILAVLNEKDVRERLAKVGAIVDPQDARQFGAFLHDETRRWSKVIQDAGITNE